MGQEDSSLQLQLSYTDPVTRQFQQSMLETPIAIGRDPSLLPNVAYGRSVTKLVLDDPQVASYHALIAEDNHRLLVTAQRRCSLQVNSVEMADGALNNGDSLSIGSITIQIQTRVAATIGETGCDHQVGFLFKRRCGRTSSEGCPHCDSGRQTKYPFLDDYSHYPSYGTYRQGSWGDSYYSDRDRYHYNSASGNVNFTDADNAALIKEADADFEQDLGAS